MADLHKCNICYIFASNKCKNCCKVYYCSKEHQLQDWKEHQEVCKPYEVFNDEIFGRYVEAMRPIKAGEVIHKEYPLLASPSKMIENSSLVSCVGCSGVVAIERSINCETCNWPLCSKACLNNPNHLPECYYILNRGQDVSKRLYGQRPGTLLMLRTLYQKELFPEVWENLNKLEYTHEKDKNGEFYNEVKAMAKDVIENLQLGNDFSLDEVQKMAGIMSANSVSFKVDGLRCRGIYKSGFIFEHSCKANCQRLFNSEGLSKIIASVPVEKGEHLSICYFDPLLTTLERQEKIQYYHTCETFVCHCERCEDPTEFGLYFSSLRCQEKNCDGNLLPASFQIKNLDWTCDKCSSKAPPETAFKIYESIEADYQNACISSDFMTFLNKHTKELPIAHSYIIRAKMELIFRTKDLQKLSRDGLTFRINSCQYIADILPILVPAERRRRNDVLYHLESLLSERYSRKRRLFNSELQNILEQRQAILNNILSISKYEAGRRHKQAEDQLKKVEIALARLHL